MHRRRQRGESAQHRRITITAGLPRLRAPRAGTFMRRRSKSGLTGLLSLVALLYAAVAPATTSEEYLREAENYLQSGEVRAAVIQLGQALLMQGAPQKVLDEITPPRDAPTALRAEVMARYGQAELALGRLQLAKDNFINAQRLNADNVAALLGLARVAMVENDSMAASVYVEQAIELAPANLDAWMLRGELVRQRGDLAGASEAFAHVLGIAPDNVLARLGRATVQIGLEE